MCFFQSCKNYNKLGDILHLALDTEEEEMFVKFLEDSKSEDIKLLYYLQRCRYMEANSGNTTTWSNSVASKNMHFDMLNAYNATLPNIVKRFSMNMGKSNLDTDLESRYPRPMTHNKSCQKTANIYETVIRKAKETYVRTEKSVVPFVTAPCAALKSSNDRININCVMSPKMVQMNNKRTLEQVIHDEENSGMRTPERTKRRKLLDDSEAALSAAFSTPLVKRKISTNRDIPIETPHSILKIRQLIRSSTSPIAASLQDEITGSPVSDREHKVNRQIRFNISQSKNSCSHGEVSREEEFSKLNTSDQNDEVFVSPATSEKCLIDSPVLSDSSYTCKNVYTARPRPSLRRTYLQTSTESINESLSNCSKTKNSANSRLSVPSVNILNNRSLTNTPQVSKRLSTLSSSSYSPAVLSPDSSFEIKVPSRRSDKSDLQRTLKTPKQENTNHNSLIASTPMTKDSSPEKPRHSSEESITTEVEEDIVPEAFYENREKTSENIDQSNHLELRNSKKLKEDVSSSKVLENINEDHEEDEEEYKSLSTNNVSCLENKEQHHRSFHEKLPNEFEHDVEKHVSSKNGVLFDITDDESSHDSDEVFLVLDEPESKEKQGSKTVPMNTDNIFDASNITDDESDSSIEILDNLQRNTAHLDKEENIRDQSRFSQKKEENAEEQETKDKSIRLDNNNSNYRRTRRNSVRGSSDHIEPKDIDNTSNLDSESLEITPRMTRSRRASSVSKETNMSPLNSPCKVLAKTPRSRRASSLVKEVLIASVAPADESVKQIASSGSDGSSGISSPRKIRGRRASSVAKDISIEAKSEEAKVPVRRSLRRSASIQKELPEISEKKVQTEIKSSNTKQSSGGANKSNTISIRSRRESQTSEQDQEEPSIVKSSRRRGSSVPKEPVNVVRTTRRSSSVAKEIVSKEFGLSSESVKEQYLVEKAVSKPAANTRSRRSSIQSIPEELEEILSVPLKERVSTTNKRQEAARNPRLRRAASMELSQVETRRKTRSARSKEIFEETIMEEEGTETISPIDDSQKVSKKRKRGVSETSTREANETTSKPRRGTKQSTKQNTKDKAANQFSFSQPEKTNDQPLDQEGTF